MGDHVDQDEAPPLPPGALRRLLAIARPHLPLMLGATFLLALMSAAGLLVPKFAGDVVDTALGGASRGELRGVVLWMIGLFALIGVIGFAESLMLGIARARLLRDLRERFFGHLIRMSAAFYGKQRVGEMLSRLGSDLEVIEGALTAQIPMGVQALLRFIGTLAVLFWLQTKLTLVALLVVPPVVLIALFVGIRVEKLSKEVRDTTATSTGLAEEVFSGIRTVQSAAAEERAFERYRGAVGRVFDVQVKDARVQAAFGGAVTFAGFTSFALVLGYGGELMLRGDMSAGDLTAFLLYTFSVALSVGQLGGLYASFRSLKGACARIFEMLDTRSEVEDGAGSLPALDGAPGIEFEDIEFSYDAGSDEAAPALQGVSLRCTPGSTVALVGPSGSGKSTLFALLLRFYDPAAGVVRVAGTDIRHLRLEDLRRAIGYVSQDVFLFSGTVAENLRLGRPQATDEEVRVALRAASALDFVEALPKGLETEIGERGLRLSGGQRQRLAIARAFLEDPPILALDEATSSLDPDSEAEVQAALSRLFEGRTTLVIAHRLATARRADRILVLDGGRISDEGTHASLIESSELYRRYWTLQSLAPDGDQDTTAAPASSSAPPSTS